MNTPAHVVLNLLCLGRRDTANVLMPVMLGAFLPDAPMFVFYGVEKLIHRTPERIIWTQSYYQENWQNLIDWFNSLPLMLVGLGVAIACHSRFGVLLFSSMMLHVAGDLPLHHDDAHRHFFPFSNWRFHSPVSYWDPRHYGNIVSVLEILAVIVSAVLLFQSYQTLPAKLSIGGIGLLYLAYFIYVFTVWV